MDSTCAAERQGRRSRPEGGYRFISTFELLMAFWAYKAGFLTWRDFRVWLACHEAVARRCRLPRGRCARYGLDELHGLVGGVGGEHIRSSLRRLERVGLVRFSVEAIHFATSPDELKVENLSGFWAMVERLGQKNRKVPVPRRTIRFIAGGVRRTVAATMLGQIIRCCYLKKGEYTAEGSCAAAWIAGLFGLDERNVKRARKHLTEIGWLIPLESDFWHRQRYGGRAVVNPTWRRPIEENFSPVPETKLPPRSEISTTKPPPLLILNGELLTESKNQNPAGADRSGVCNEEPEKKPPTMKHVEIEDLRDTERTLLLFEEAVEHRVGGLTGSEGDRLKFVAAAERAISVGTENPPGFFARIVRSGLWHHITQGDEDAAHRRLKRHFFGAAKREKPKPVRYPRPPLSADAKLMLAVKRVATQHRMTCDPFHLLHRERPDWTRERWEAAVTEVESVRFERVTGSERVNHV